MSALALGGALAAVGLLYAGVKELLSGNPKGIIWGAILAAGGVAAASFAGVDTSAAAQAVGEVLSVLIGVLSTAVATVANAAGISAAVVWLAIGLAVLFKARNGKK